ncbi:MAG: 50S ribosomal protein L30 [Flammeovirgaceae bacterium]|nr:50S ribosomal protein L30 [Flammeovirgaceae bacterium]|tara:strand:- start:3251 stop:3442 length:192 start_codon:yes stop_codon:yes gene_type:complete
MDNYKGKLLLTQVKSLISKNQKQKRTIVALGLGKINKSVTKKASPEVIGMIKTVNHLIQVKKI